MADELIKDSVLPMVLQNRRFLILESLLTRLNGLEKYTIIMLVDLLPDSTLIFFSDHFSLFGDGWEQTQSAQDRRNLIKSAIEIHRHKGTKWAIKRTLALLGYENCEIYERVGYNLHDASIKHDASRRYSSQAGWTHYELYIPYLVTESEANRIRNLLADVAPLRCLLVAIKMQLTYDNRIKHDATFKHQGVISWQAN